MAIIGFLNFAFLRIFINKIFNFSVFNQAVLVPLSLATASLSDSRGGDIMAALVINQDYAVFYDNLPRADNGFAAEN